MKCPVCDGTRRKPMISLGEFRVERCEGCALGITHPFPDLHEQRQTNTKMYTTVRRRSAYAAREAEFKQRYRGQLSRISEQFDNRTKPIRIVDVGCSTGNFLKEAREMGFDVSGVELSAETARYAQEIHGLPVYTGTLQDADFEPASVDVVTFWDVLEHVPDPGSTLRETHRILKDGGLVVIQSPNCDSWMREHTDRLWHWWLLPDHLYHFSPETLSSLICKFDFRIVSLNTWEPGLDLLANIIDVKVPVNGSIVNRVLRSMLYRLAVAMPNIALVWQKRNWRKDRGALIEVFARK